MAGHSIEKLSPELLYLILESLASPQDLLALILSSKTFHTLFSQSRERIVSQVLCNSYGDNLQQALGAFYASTIHDSNDDTWTSEQRREVEALLTNYHNRHLELPTNFEDIVEMCHQSALVERVIGHHSNYASLFFAEGPETSSRDSSHCLDNPIGLQDPPLFLSTVEKGRIRRAFLHFDMYCHLFPLSRFGISPQPFDATGQSELFLSKISMWEVEELCAAQQFICNILDQIVQTLEDEFVQEVLLLPKLDAPPDGEFDPSVTDTGNALELFGLELFTSTSPQQRFDILFQVSSQGLRSLEDIMIGNAATQRQHILKFWPWRGDFLWQGVRTLLTDSAARKSVKDHPFEGEDRLDGFSGGWSFVSNRKLVSNRNSWAPNRGDQAGWGNAADAGFAFWNYARGEALSVSGKAKLPQKERASAEKRLWGHHVAFSEFRDILEKYSPEDFLPR
ncbi:unnamed protein product [Clonostachys solani]|uniref:F-box domain-containing protein n=1 Tax=Clonostachys solani TaxID=160281 RepID=A0A9N9YZY0_9HYPO|nr:unnamed protein product [Clonostachys solani]